MLADTAKLAIDLSLTGNARTGLAGVSKQLAGIDRQTGKIGQGFKTLGAGIGVAFRNAAFIGIAALGGLAALVTKSVREGQEAAKVQTIYATAITNSAKSTGVFNAQLKAANATLAKAEGAHKKNTKEIQKAKDAVAALTVRQSFLGPVTAQQTAALNKQQTVLMNLAGIDDEAIKSSQTRLIQMGLNGAAVEKITPLILDFAKATGLDLNTATKLVGKSINGNIGALARYGVQVDKTKAKVDPFGATQDALNSKFLGTTKALSGSLEARLGAFRENLANIREEAGIKLLPALTRIVDVAGKDLVPAFGKFIDRIMPSLISGIDKFASMLENGGAERGIKAITDALGPMVELLKLAAAPVKAIVSAFLSLPSQVQGVLIGAFAVNKLSGGLIAKGVGEIAGGVLQRGGTPANPLFVMDVSGGLGGPLGKLGGFNPAMLIPLVAVAAAEIGIAGALAKPIRDALGIPEGGTGRQFQLGPLNARLGGSDAALFRAQQAAAIPAGAGGGSLTGAIAAAVAKLFKAVANSPGAVAAGAALARRGVTERAAAAGFHPSEAAIQRTLDKNAKHAEVIQARIAASTKATADRMLALPGAISAALRGIILSNPTTVNSSTGFTVPLRKPKVINSSTGFSLPARAGGGPAWARQDYLVGERGPEILRMGSRSGTVMPNSAPSTVVNARVAVSTRDVNTGQTVKGRYGPTYTQAGAG